MANELNELVSVANSNTKLTFRQQWKLGIRPVQVWKRCKTLSRQGVIDKDMSPRDIAYAVMVDCATDDRFAQAWQEDVASGNIDWEAIADFLERVVELLLKILPLFISVLPLMLCLFV